jgi:glycosyltransferase involved in cell wall biosynthesis
VSGPEISVLVPTRDRPASLARCLAALERQTVRGELEIVVIDDGSKSASSVAQVVGRTAGARLVRQESRGVAAARNAGAQVALAPVICVTDDDCVAAPEWAERLRGAIRAGADAAAGATRNLRREDPLAEATQTIVNYLAERSLGAPPTTSFAPGSNLAYTAETARAMAFDERYGPGGEDRDWCARLVASGRKLVWEPAAVVHHEQELTLARFLRKHANWGRGAFRFRRTHPAVPPPKSSDFYGGLVRRGFQSGMAAGLCVCLAQVAAAAGYFEAALTDRGWSPPGVPPADGRRRSAD